MTESQDRAADRVDQTDRAAEGQTDGQDEQATEEEVEQERRERLDPDNRPDEAEVDNSDRDFDEEKGMFTDSEGYEEAEEQFPPMGEQGA